MIQFTELEGIRVFFCEREACLLTPDACISRQQSYFGKPSAHTDFLVLEKKCEGCPQGKQIRKIYGLKQPDEKRLTRKPCSICGENLTLDHFSKNPFGHLSSQCKTCQAENRRQKNRVRQIIKEEVVYH